MLEQRSTVLECLLYQFVFVLREFGTIRSFYIRGNSVYLMPLFIKFVARKYIYWSFIELEYLLHPLALRQLPTTLLVCLNYIGYLNLPAFFSILYNSLASSSNFSSVPSCTVGGHLIIAHNQPLNCRCHICVHHCDSGRHNYSIWIDNDKPIMCIKNIYRHFRFILFFMPIILTILKLSWKLQEEQYLKFDLNSS